MTKQHPITPPPELVKQWEEQFLERPTINGCFIQSYIATQAARWGADQELEACCKWLPKLPPWSGNDLRKHRRPNPPSLKDQALVVLDDCANCLDGAHENTIRRDWRPSMTDPTAAMSPGTVEEAKAAKMALSARIATALAQFTADTGLAVESLDVTQLQVYGGEVRYYVEAEVRL